jgi:hypothetical protein
MSEISITPKKQLVNFDLSINLGHVLTIATLLGTMGVAYATYSVTVHSHDLRLRFVESQVQSLVNTNKELTTTMYTLRQDVAIIRDRIENRLPPR